MMISADAQPVIRDKGTVDEAARRSLDEEREGAEAAAKVARLPEGTLVSGVLLNGVPCEWVERVDSDTQVVLLIHGGGFHSGSPRTHRRFAAVLAKASGQRVLVPDYRLAPENPFPAGLDDVIAVYAALVEAGTDPHSIAFCGEAAGGGLALSAALALRDIEAPLPHRLVLMSPWTDLTLSGASHRRNRTYPNPSEAELQRSAQWYVGPTTLDEPLISPLFAELAGLPPMLAQAGEHDVLVDDAVRLAERARGAGVDLELTVFAGVGHAFQLADCPEARMAVEQTAAFVNNVQASVAVA